jgi:hypothetical protein
MTSVTVPLTVRCPTTNLNKCVNCKAGHFKLNADCLVKAGIVHLHRGTLLQLCQYSA